jgi:hypothetical protein
LPKLSVDTLEKLLCEPLAKLAKSSSPQASALGKIQFPALPVAAAKQRSDQEACISRAGYLVTGIGRQNHLYGRLRLIG